MAMRIYVSILLAVTIAATLSAAPADDRSRLSVRDGAELAQDAGEWPEKAAIQLRRTVKLKAGTQCLEAEYSYDCVDDGSDDWGGACMSCYNPCMINFACSMNATNSCYSRSYTRCRNVTRSDGHRTCEAC